MLPKLWNDDKRPPSKEELAERTIVWNLIAHLAQGGYHVKSVDDGGDARVPCATPVEAMEAIFSVMESQLVVRHPDDKKNMTIVLIRGNEPEEIIADHSVPDHDPNGFRKLMNSFDVTNTWVNVNLPLCDFVNNLVAGMQIEVAEHDGLKRYLIGDYNELCGVCNCCSDGGSTSIVTRYRMINLEG